MVHHTTFIVSLSISTELFTIDFKVITASKFSLNSQISKCSDYRLRESLKVKSTFICLIRDDGIVQVIQIVINSATTRQTANNLDTMSICIFFVNLLNGILVFTNNDSWTVNPKNEQFIFIHQFTKSIGFQSNIIGRII